MSTVQHSSSPTALPCSPYALVRPVQTSPRTEDMSLHLVVTSPSEELSPILGGRTSPNSPMSLDIETRGNDPTASDSLIVGIGLSDDRGSWYIDLRESHEDTLRYLVYSLEAKQVPLLAHNLFFDASYIRRDFPECNNLNWRACTYALLRLLATEGFLGQSWSLKNAQRDLLGWKETNEKQLDEWLVSNGYYTSVKKEWTTGYIYDESEDRWKKPNKAEMWRAPSDILGYYCALDADSTYLLYTQVLEPVLGKFPRLRSYYESIWTQHIMLHIEQKLRGIHVNRDGIERYLVQLGQEIETAYQAFYQHPNVAPHLREYDMGVLQKHRDKEPPQYLKQKVGKEPARLKRDGTVSKNWLKWKERADTPPKLSKSWEIWNAKLIQLESTTHFNLNSGEQLRWLFYERLGNEVLFTTDTGAPSVGKNAIRGFGEAGQLLHTYNKKVKERSYVESCLKSLRWSEEERSWVLHPSFRCPGTLTGRLSGAGGFNLQQQPKSVSYLWHFHARPGHKWVTVDFTSLEDMVITELSRDSSLLKLYGPDAPPVQDGHLFVGSNLPVIGPKIRAAGYDPEAPTKEGIERAKAECKKERGLAKTIKYASVYKAGPKKIQQTLRLEGIDLPLEEVKKMHRGYWELHKGIVALETDLKRQWKANGGWYFNGIGRPICLDVQREKDLISANVQSTGHDCLLLWVSIWVRMLQERGITWYPIVLDYHDESIVEVPEDSADETLRILKEDSFEELNRLLGGLIPLRGDGDVIGNLAEAKVSNKEIEEYLEGEEEEGEELQ